MQIRVKCNCNEENCEEWGIVELQGVVESQPGFQDSLANLQIGILCRLSSQVTYLLTLFCSTLIIINYTN
jgi:chromosome transmission fidelity protein 8